MKKLIKQVIVSLCLAISIIAGLCGCANESTSKKFEKAGLTITLTTEFYEKEHVEYTAYYASSKMIVVTIKESFNSFEKIGQDAETMSVEEYARLVIDVYQDFYNSASEISVENDMVSFTYENDALGKDYKFVWYGFKAVDAFWAVQFGCVDANFDSLQSEMLAYAKTVEIERFEETLDFEKIEGKDEYCVVGLGSVCGVDIVVPAEYNGLPVTEIKGGVWGEKHNSIKSVVLPDTVTKIGRGLFASMLNLKRVQLGNAVTTIDDYAFQRCSYLEEVALPDTVKSIGMEAFAYCYRLKHINLGNVELVDTAAFFQCKALEKLQIPETMISIGYSVFAGCENLKTVEFSETLKIIGTAAFQGCINLTEIIIPNSVTEIKGGAFDQCFALEKVTIPDSVTLIGGSAFTDCPKLQYSEYENCLYLGNESNPYLYLAKTNDTYIAHGKTHLDTKFIAGKAFSNCYNLMSFELQPSIKEIGFSAFENCYKLLEIYNKSSLHITIDDRTTNGGIGAYATNVYTQAGQGMLLVDEEGYVVFEENGARILLGYGGAEKNLNLPSDITEIYPRAFYRRQDIQSVILGNEVETIGELAFAYCGLKNIQFGKNLLDIANNAFMNSYVEQVDFPDSLKTIGKQAFSQCANLKKLAFGDSVETIGEEAFSQCTSLKKVEIPDSVVLLGTRAFVACTGLQEAIVGDQVQAEKLDWFNSCSSLQRLVLGNSITVVDATAFAWMKSLTSVVIGNSVHTINERAFEDCTSLAEVTFGESLKTISWGAFQRTALVQVQLPNSLEILGSSAFANCKNLTSVTISNSLTKIYNNVFDGCSVLESVMLGDSVKEIGANAFRFCENLTSISIPEGIVSIDKDAFAHCDNLQYTEYENSYYLGNEENPYVALISVLSKDIKNATMHAQTKLICDYAFMNCGSLTQVSLPNSLRAIGVRAFCSCNQLKEIIMPDTVEYVGDMAFASCTELSNVKLSNTLTAIGDSAFSYCVKLNQIVFPSSLKTIGTYAFDNCSSLRTIEMPCSVQSIGSMAFRSCVNLMRVTLPNGLTTIESGTFWLCRNLMEIIIPDTLTTIGDLAFEDCNALKNIYFTGNEISDSLQVLINKHEALLNATIYVYKETEPELNDTGTEYKGNYWHYVNGEPTIWTYYEEE